MDPFEYTAKRVDFHGHIIQTYSFGKGEKVILSLPSYPCSGLFYIYFTHFYKHKNFKIITFDLPGWAGWSDNFLKDERSAIDTYVDIAKTVLKSYEVDTFNVIGYSYGGAVAIRLAKALPRKIHKIAFVSTVGFQEKLVPYAYYRLIRLGYILRKALFFPANSALRLFIDSELTPLFKNVREIYGDEVVREAKAMFKQINNRAIFNSIYELFTTSLTEDLKAIKKNHKFLVVSSKDELPVFRKQSEHIRKILENEKSLKITGKHEDFIGRPKAPVVEQVMNFLTK